MTNHKTHEEFCSEISAKFPQIKVLGRYVNSNTPILFQCTDHNYTFEKKPSLVLHSEYGCTMCATDKKVHGTKKSPKWFEAELKKKCPSVIQLTEYTLMQNKIRVKCKCCGHEWDAKACDLIRGHGCRKCATASMAKRRIHSHDHFINEINKYNPHADRIEILSKYKGVYSPISCKCKDCGNIWETNASNLIDKRGGSGCPICGLSKGEIIASQILTEMGIQFETQKEFNGLVGISGMPLSYDFYIPSFNVLIEIQGGQHYLPVKYFGGERKYKRQIEHDRRKREFAKNSDIELLEIPYRDYKDIDRIRNSLIEKFT